MPNCIKFISKASKEAVSLSKIDEEICNLLGVEVHENLYGGGYVKGSFNWFDIIGFRISTNNDNNLGQPALREYYKESTIWKEDLPVINKILDYLEENYTSSAWYQVGK